MEIEKKIHRDLSGTVHCRKSPLIADHLILWNETQQMLKDMVFVSGT